MKKDINYYNYHVGEGRDEDQPNNELTWNAYIEDRNSNTIKVFNIFNSFRFISDVIKANVDSKIKVIKIAHITFITLGDCY